MQTMAEIDTQEIEVIRTISKPRSDVWRGLTREIQEWWPKDFYIGPYENIEPLGISLDARIGGLLAEDWGDGDGLVWGTVIACRKDSMLLVAGDSTGQWGGPNRGYSEYRLKDVDGKTQITFKHEAWGQVPASTASSLDEGWNTLMDCLGRWVELGERPERPPSVT